MNYIKKSKLNILVTDPFPVSTQRGNGRSRTKLCYFLGSFGMGRSSHGRLSKNVASRVLGDVLFAINMMNLFFIFSSNVWWHKWYGGYFHCCWMIHSGDLLTASRIFSTGQPQKVVSSIYHIMLCGKFGVLVTV